MADYRQIKIFSGGGIAAWLVGLFVAALALPVQANADVTHVLKRSGDPVPLPLRGQADAFASCDVGEKLIGGGALGTGHYGTLLSISAPDPNNRHRWFARARDDGANEQGTGTLTAYAFCASDRGRDRIRDVVRRPGPSLDLPAPGGDAFAACHTDEKLIGGGAIADPAEDKEPTLRLSAPDPNDPKRWFTRASNPAGLSAELRAYALCAKRSGSDHLDRISRESRSVAVQGEGGRVAVPCEDGSLVGGGALSTQSPGTWYPHILFGSGPSTDARWLVGTTTGPTGGPPETLTGYAFCAS